MKAIVPQKTQRELIPAGNHPARVFEIIEIGTVDGQWMGEAKKTHKVRIGFEFPTEKRVFDESKGEQPMVTSKEMALSFGDLAGLRKIVEAIEGKKLTDAEAVNYDIESKFKHRTKTLKEILNSKIYKNEEQDKNFLQNRYNEDTEHGQTEKIKKEEIKHLEEFISTKRPNDAF
jgi:hypothetical protein